MQLFSMLVIFIQTLFYCRNRRVNIGFDNEQRYLGLRCVYHSYVAPRIRGGFEYPRRNARTSLHFSSAYGYLAVTGADAYFYLFVFGSELSRYLEHAAEIVVADRKRKPRMRTVRQKLRDHVNVYSHFGNFFEDARNEAYVGGGVTERKRVAFSLTLIDSIIFTSSHPFCLSCRSCRRDPVLCFV